MQQYFDIARIFKHYPGDEGYDINHTKHQEAVRDASRYGAAYYDDEYYDDDDYDRPQSDEEMDEEDQQRVKEHAPAGTVYSSVGGPLRRREQESPSYEYGTRPERANIERREGGWAGHPDTGKEENPFSIQQGRKETGRFKRTTTNQGAEVEDEKVGLQRMVKGDEYKLHQQGKMGGTEEIYSMGNRSKTQVQKMYRIFKAPSRLQDTLDRQAQASASVRGGPEGQGGPGTFDEAQQIGRGVIDQTISGVMYGMGGRRGSLGQPSSNGTGRTEEEGLPPVPNNEPRTDTTQTSQQTTPTAQPQTPKPPTGPAQNPMEQLGAKPKAGAGPSFKPKPTGQQYYSQDVKMVEKMARIFRV